MNPPQEHVKSDVVWVLSYSIAGNDFALKNIGLPHISLLRPITIVRTAFQAPLPDQSEPDQIETDRRLCAVILVVERRGFDEVDYRKWVSRCIKRVAEKDDFRLFITLYQTTVDEVDRLAKEDECAASLRDTVQFSSENTDDLRDSLAGFLENIEDIRDATRMRRWWGWISIAAGYVATITQLMSVIGVFITVAYLFYHGQHTPVELTNLSKSLIAMMIGSVVPPTATCFLAILVKRELLNVELVQQTKSFLALFSLFLFPLSLLILILSATLMRQVNGEYSWLVAGIVTGLLLDAVRRNGNRARLVSRNIDPSTATPRGQPLPQPLRDTIDGHPPFLLNATVFSEANSRVFISYTRSLEFSSAWARKIYTALRGAGVECFLDRFSIREGTCWRKTLNRRIGESNVFIALMENDSVDRPWLAAELETALESARLTGAPDIFILTHPTLRVEDHAPRLPAFDAILNRRDPLKGPRMAKLEETTVKVLVNELRTYRFHLMNAIVPRAVDAVVRGLAFPLMSILLLVGPLGTVFGWVAIILAILQATGIVDPLGYLSSYNLLTPAFLLCGFWSGFIGRLAAASRFEVRLPQKTGVSRMQWLMVAGYLFLMMQWLPMVQLLIIVWGGVLCGIGWYSGNAFIFHIRQGKPEIKREEK